MMSVPAQNQDGMIFSRAEYRRHILFHQRQRAGSAADFFNYLEDEGRFFPLDPFETPEFQQS